jgi:hypothetical protein
MNLHAMMAFLTLITSDDEHSNDCSCSCHHAGQKRQPAARPKTTTNNNGTKERRTHGDEFHSARNR